MKQNPPEQDVFDHDGYEPIPERKRSFLGWVIAGLIALMLVYELAGQPPDPAGRFRLLVDENVAYAYGGTDTDSLGEMERFLDANPQVDRIVLRNVPGTTDMATNTRIARLIRERGIATHLDRRSYIASGGVHLFLGGAERTMACGARIGVHSWKDTEGETPRSLGFDPAESYMQAFHRDMGVDEAFYAFSRDAAPHETVYLLRPAEIDRYDLLTTETCEKTGLFG